MQMRLSLATKRVQMCFILTLPVASTIAYETDHHCYYYCEPAFMCKPLYVLLS